MTRKKPAHLLPQISPNPLPPQHIGHRGVSPREPAHLLTCPHLNLDLHNRCVADLAPNHRHAHPATVTLSSLQKLPNTATVLGSKYGIRTVAVECGRVPMQAWCCEPGQGRKEAAVNDNTWCRRSPGRIPRRHSFLASSASANTGGQPVLPTNWPPFFFPRLLVMPPDSATPVPAGLSSTSSAFRLVRVSQSALGPISGNVGNGCRSTYASAMLIGRHPFFFANSRARSPAAGSYHLHTSSAPALHPPSYPALPGHPGRTREPGCSRRTAAYSAL